ncbi:hypothetical protein FUSO4_01870 [Fusobacterium necrophorum DJ-1]|uniref:Uncharacterized protein n=1 Tax=Fusobacterium necrophorum DJ-2 TaxID=1441737 RepID=A0AB73C3L0_9FUSO|nr:hypothetical protein FUSO5_00190 [Fusobacterium necrophorum BFTR-1]KDE67901.1 hypothetical protein FUSO4_01870 [Fusobacterium necrophorum DJ-1]KDE72500.1 hypothetical protein FUSO8_04955 [Fusobacterium necrophorum DJ-2]
MKIKIIKTKYGNFEYMERNPFTFFIKLRRKK